MILQQISYDSFENMKWRKRIEEFCLGILCMRRKKACKMENTHKSRGWAFINTTDDFYHLVF